MLNFFLSISLSINLSLSLYMGLFICLFTRISCVCTFKTCHWQINFPRVNFVWKFEYKLLLRLNLHLKSSKSNKWYFYTLFYWKKISLRLLSNNLISIKITCKWTWTKFFWVQSKITYNYFQIISEQITYNFFYESTYKDSWTTSFGTKWLTFIIN